MEKARIVLNISADVRDWYKEQAISYGVTMAGLMSMTLTKNMENVKSMEMLSTLKDISELSKLTDKELSEKLEIYKKLLEK